MADSEVTVDQYQQCIEAGACDFKGSKHMRGNAMTCYRDQNKYKYPVNCLEGKQARAFSFWVGGSLPTKALWNQAAHHEQFTSHKQKDTLIPVYDTIAWHKGNSDGYVHPIKQKKPNLYGLYDMFGNLAEFVINISNQTYNELSIRGGSWNNTVKVGRDGHIYHNSSSKNKRLKKGEVGFRPMYVP